MKKFRCVVTRTDEYEIEIDETKINKEWMKNFNSYMYGFDTLKEHAEHLAQLRARQGESFYDGYGYVSVNGEPPIAVALSELNQKSYNPSFNIKVLSEDSDIEIETLEV